MNGKKISAQIAGGALASIVVWLINAFSGVQVPAEVAVAFGTVFAIVVTLIVPGKMEDDAPEVVSKSQSGFAMIGQLIVALIFAIVVVVSVSGCSGAGGFLRTAEPIAVPTSLPEAGKAAQQAINEANIALTAAYRVIGDNAEAGVWTKGQAQGYMDKVNGYSGQVDEAQAALDRGMWATAASQAALVNQLILALSKEVASQARKAGTQQ